jgi:hypothetical protein
MNYVVKSHKLAEDEWVLERHEDPKKFESKWFGSYQIMEKMMLGTYRLQDPNGKELTALVHGNRLLRAYISSTEILKKLWASPAAKGQLRRRNITTEYIGSDNPQNTELLEHYLFEDDDQNYQDEQIATDSHHQHIGRNNQSTAQELLDCIIIEQSRSNGRLRRGRLWVT